MPRITLRSLVAVAALLLASSHARAQRIQGQVRYNNSQVAANVPVRCDGSGGNSIQMTDEKGGFFFSVSPGNYTVTIHLPGYKEEERSVYLVDASAGEYMFIRLRPEEEDEARPSPGMGRVVDARVPAEARKEYEKALASLAGGKREKIEEGVRHLESAVQIYPDFLEAHMRLGLAYMDLREWEGAEREFERVLAINPNAAGAYFAIGEVYLRQGRQAEAEKSLLKGLELDDHSWRGHFTLARVYWGRDDFVRAGRQVGLTIQLNPRFADAHLLAGNVLARAGKREDALAEFREYLRLAPKGEYAAQARESVRKLSHPDDK